MTRVVVTMPTGSPAGGRPNQNIMINDPNHVSRFVSVLHFVLCFDFYVVFFVLCVLFCVVLLLVGFQKDEVIEGTS